MANVYGSKYSQQWPTAEAVNLAKREWADRIGCFSRDQIDQMFSNVKSMLIAGDDDWQWPEIGRILGGLSTNWEHRRIAAADAEHEPILRLDNKTAREQRRSINRERMKALRESVGI